MRVQPKYISQNVSGLNFTQVATGAGTLHTVVLGSTSAQAITIMDGVAATTVLIGTLSANATTGTYLYDCAFSYGLRVNAPAAANLTLTFNIGS